MHYDEYLFIPVDLIGGKTFRSQGALLTLTAVGSVPIYAADTYEATCIRQMVIILGLFCHGRNLMLFIIQL
jgi:hypothetical protein